MDLKETRCENVRRMELVQDSFWRWALVLTMSNLRVPLPAS
jgi:hypothetical protein